MLSRGKEVKRNKLKRYTGERKEGDVIKRKENGEDAHESRRRECYQEEGMSRGTR